MAVLDGLGGGGEVSNFIGPVRRIGWQQNKSPYHPEAGW
jgi:hypothetical protein